MSFENLIDKVIDRIQNELDGSFEVEASGRHVHLSRKELDALFGTGYELTKAKDLSQPGQYASKERLTVVGPKGAFHNVVILGPVRKESQVEVSLTDCLQLGVKAPIRESGDIEGTPGIVLVNGDLHHLQLLSVRTNIPNAFGLASIPLSISSLPCSCLPPLLFLYLYYIIHHLICQYHLKYFFVKYCEIIFHQIFT